MMRLLISVFSSSSDCSSSSLSAALVLDFPSSTFLFFTHTRVSPFVVFRMLEVLLLISPFFGIAHDPLNTLLPRFDLKENYIRVVVLLIHVHLCSSSLSSLGGAFFTAAAFALTLGFAEDGVAATGIFADEKVVATDFVGFFTGSRSPPLMPLGHWRLRY